jgi:hypothetical protein
MAISTSATPQRSASGWVMLIGGAILVIALVIGAAFALSAGALKTVLPEDGAVNSLEAKLPDMENLEQCRVDAVTAYMTSQGFKDGDYVVSESRVDRSAPEFSEHGSMAFGIDGHVVDSREALQEVFDSEEKNLKAVTDAQVQKFPNMNRDDVLNAHYWEIVQTTVAANVNGNTGLDGETVVDAGTRESDAGDAAWIMIDPATCTVPTGTVTATGMELTSDIAEADKPVGFIRVGCINPGDGFKPKPPPPAPPTTPETPDNPPPAQVCPPDMPHGEWPNCKDDSSRDPGPRGNAPIGQGPNADPGPGTYIPPQEMEQPPSTPYVPPAPPAPAPPAAPAPGPAPAPVPTRDPAPAPAPEPSAPPPSAPETGCDASVPGVVC